VRHILLVDDQTLFVECLRNTIATLAPDLFTVEVVHSADEALHRIDRRRPDIVLMDVQLPGTDGIRATELIHERYPAVKVVMLSAFRFDDYVREALRCGAVGYLLKDIEPRQLVDELSRLSSDQLVISRSAAAAIAPDRSTTEGGRSPVPRWLLELTAKERQILLHLSQGASNEEIAQKVFLGNQTVRNYLSSIYRKMGVATRYEAILHALEAHIKDVVTS
jgi:DNA-binding NarL/FixJ family response regulator